MIKPFIIYCNYYDEIFYCILQFTVYCNLLLYIANFLLCIVIMINPLLCIVTMIKPFIVYHSHCEFI